MRILMLGNSFTSTNNLPEMLSERTGAQVIHHTRGGARLAEHLNPGTGLGARTLAALEAEKWDYVILQEMSNGPVVSPERFLHSTGELCKRIRAAGAEPVLYATWAYQRGGKKLADFGMSYEAMANEMQVMYQRAADVCSCLIAQVGKAFFERADVEELYAEDGCHPNKRGSQLAADILAAVILEDYKKKSKRLSSDRQNFSSIEEAVADLFTPDTRITSMTSVPGGDINAAWSLLVSGGRRIFAKTHSGNCASMFQAEALGLAALKSAEAIGVPEVLAVGYEEGKERSFLLLENIEPAPRREDYWEIFGKELAGMHLAETEAFLPGDARGCHFGFLSDNYIGTTVQNNTPKSSWIDFYRECRLEPQIILAEDMLPSGILRKLIRLLDRLEELLREPEKASLLHGDLWSGNQMCGPDGKAWILDPAAYVGDFEADLAMTELFGAFPESFYRAYATVNPVEPEYGERRELYDLYHLLNHLNLFGEAYLLDVCNIADRFA